MWNLVSVHLETVLVSVQDRCLICNEHTIGSEIISDAPNLHLGEVGHVESRFGLLGASVGAR